MGCHFLFQGIFPTQGSNPHLLCYQEACLQLCHASPVYPSSPWHLIWMCINKTPVYKLDNNKVSWGPGSFCPVPYPSSSLHHQRHPIDPDSLRTVYRNRVPRSPGSVLRSQHQNKRARQLGLCGPWVTISAMPQLSHGRSAPAHHLTWWPQMKVVVLNDLKNFVLSEQLVCFLFLVNKN